MRAATVLGLLKCLPNTFLRIDSQPDTGLASSPLCVCLFKGGVFKHSAYYLLAKHPPTEKKRQEITAPYNTASNNKESQWKLHLFLLSLFLLFLVLLLLLLSKTLSEMIIMVQTTNSGGGRGRGRGCFSIVDSFMTCRRRKS